MKWYTRQEVKLEDLEFDAGEVRRWDDDGQPLEQSTVRVHVGDALLFAGTAEEANLFARKLDVATKKAYGIDRAARERFPEGIR